MAVITTNGSSTTADAIEGETLAICGGAAAQHVPPLAPI